MIASEMVERLQKLVAAFGDCEMWIQHPNRPDEHFVITGLRHECRKEKESFVELSTGSGDR